MAGQPTSPPEEGTGDVCYEPQNNQRMHELRRAKVQAIANEIPLAEVQGPDRGELLLVGWGGTFGAIASAADSARRDGLSVSHLHLRHLHPFPSNLGEVLGRFEKVLVPELNLGQLSQLLRSEFLVDAQLLGKVEGQPFRIEEIRARIDVLLDRES